MGHSIGQARCELKITLSCIMYFLRLCVGTMKIWLFLQNQRLLKISSENSRIYGEMCETTEALPNQNTEIVVTILWRNSDLQFIVYVHIALNRKHILCILVCTYICRGNYQGVWNFSGTKKTLKQDWLNEDFMKLIPCQMKTILRHKHGN